MSEDKRCLSLPQHVKSPNPWNVQAAANGRDFYPATLALDVNFMGGDGLAVRHRVRNQERVGARKNSRLALSVKFPFCTQVATVAIA